MCIYLLFYSLDEDQIDIDGKEFHLARQLERIKDILDEFNPLHFGDEDEIDESEEERQSRRLERAQKRAMKKLEQRLSVAHQDENVDTTALFEEETNVSDSSDDGEMDYENLNQPRDVDTQVQARARQNADIKLKEKFDNYRKELANGGSVDMKQVIIKWESK